MSVVDRLISFNARLARFTIPNVLFKAVLGYALAGVLMAVLVPPLHARGVKVQGWMVWSVIAGMMAICIAPDVYQRYRRRGAG